MLIACYVVSCNRSLTHRQQFCLSCQKSGNALKICRCACCALCGPRRRSSIFTRLPYCCSDVTSASAATLASASTPMSALASALRCHGNLGQWPLSWFLLLLLYVSVVVSALFIVCVRSSSSEKPAGRLATPVFGWQPFRLVALSPCPCSLALVLFALRFDASYRKFTCAFMCARTCYRLLYFFFFFFCSTRTVGSRAVYFGKGWVTPVLTCVRVCVAGIL